MARRHPGVLTVERILKKQGFAFIYVSPVGWKIYDSHRVEFSWLEYRFDPNEDRIYLNVDKLRDGADNFATLVNLWHGVHVDY